MSRWLPKLRELTRSTFALTAGERKAVGLVLALALLGLSVKFWHAQQGQQVNVTRQTGRMWEGHSVPR